jgi:hypothetical protein
LWQGKIKKLLIMQSPPLPSNPVPLRPKYPPQHPALKLPFFRQLSSAQLCPVLSNSMCLRSKHSQLDAT